MWILLSVVVGMLSSVEARVAVEPPPPSVRLSTVSTSFLAEQCARPAVPLEMNGCNAYIVAAFDQLSLTGAVCPSAGFSTEQAIGVGRRYVREHPEAWQAPPSVLLRAAFRQVFPCG